MISTVKLSQLCNRFSDIPKFELYGKLNIELLLSLYHDDLIIIGSTCMCCSILHHANMSVQYIEDIQIFC